MPLLDPRPPRDPRRPPRPRRLRRSRRRLLDRGPGDALVAAGARQARRGRRDRRRALARRRPSRSRSPSRARSSRPVIVIIDQAPEDGAPRVARRDPRHLLAGGRAGDRPAGPDRPHVGLVRDRIRPGLRARVQHPQRLRQPRSARRRPPGDDLHGATRRPLTLSRITSTRRPLDQRLAAHPRPAPGHLRLRGSDLRRAGGDRPLSPGAGRPDPPDSRRGPLAQRREARAGGAR